MFRVKCLEGEDCSMWDFFSKVSVKLFSWIWGMRKRPMVKITLINVEDISKKKKKISFRAFITNNTNKPISVTQKEVRFFCENKEIACMDTTKYEIQKRQDVFEELNILSPIDDIFYLKSGETKEISVTDRIIEVGEIDKIKFFCSVNKRTYSYNVNYSRQKRIEKRETTENVGEKKEELLKDIILKQFMFLNKNIGAITWMTTIVVAIVSTVAKFMWYVFQRGRLLYWQISPIAISSVDGLTLYNIFLLFIIGIVCMSLMLIPFFVIRSKIKKIYKIIINLILHIVVIGYMLLKIRWDLFLIYKDLTYAMSVFLIVLLADLVLFSASWIFLLLVPKKNICFCFKKDSVIKALFLLCIWFVIMTFYSGLVGYDNEKNRTSFPVIEDKYAILYENNEYYYMAEYDAHNNRIIKGKQIIVKKDNIEISMRHNVSKK